jgi:hypothetical protein
MSALPMRADMLRMGTDVRHKQTYALPIPGLWLIIVIQKDSFRRAVHVLVLLGTQRP